MEPSQKAALDKFLAENDDLEKLSARLATFNIFRALKVEGAEIRHSNTLGWLLDPGQSHGLGDLFLRRILSNMLLDSGFKPLSAAAVELMDFRGDVEVRREWKHIDVLVIDRSNKLLLLIENKVCGGETKGQLSRYRKIAESEFPGFILVPIFLTLEGDATEDDDADYICYSHRQLLQVLERIMAQRKEQMPEAVFMFLTHYIATLRRLAMQDDSLIELCQRIYRKHREAIKLIVEYGEASAFEQVAQEVVGTGDFEILRAAPTNIWFLPSSWRQVIPENGTAWPQLSRRVSVACWMDIWRDKLSVVFEVCRMTDPALRLACVKKLSEQGFKLTKKAFKEDATYSRFFTMSHPLRDATDEEEMRDGLNKLMAKAKELFPKAEAVLKKVFGATA